MDTHYRLIAIDEGRQQLMLVHTNLPHPVWVLDLADYPLARDLQRLDGQRVLVGFARGFFELDIASGHVLAACDRWHNVTAVQRRADGCTLVTGIDLDGSGGVNVLTLDRDLAVVHCARRDGDYVRLMRTTPQDSYLLCTNDHILETTPDLATLRSFEAAGFEHAWKAERLADGATLVSAGYGAFMARFNADGICVKLFGDEGTVPAEVAPFFYASFERLDNGRLLVANWQGHGPDNGRKGRQLLEFNGDGGLLRSWSFGGHISSLQGILLV
ncbi:hypothetical protein [Duganella sp. Root1480D1]|uniref:hypothetical protein n=1 Tax=Duganella sp. Root1480D1 TaxID=1736471 RepID=UPI00070D479C|nr:hypothetical protein [Duganella sp. Root1480D1]KQZ43183.1 hypothetical protein ASD58_23245 [Duganella sp. Root1480D1]